jgi:hypothetical protein
MMPKHISWQTDLCRGRPCPRKCWLRYIRHSGRAVLCEPDSTIRARPVVPGRRCDSINMRLDDYSDRAAQPPKALFDSISDARTLESFAREDPAEYTSSVLRAGSSASRKRGLAVFSKCRLVTVLAILAAQDAIPFRWPAELHGLQSTSWTRENPLRPSASAVTRI